MNRRFGVVALVAAIAVAGCAEERSSTSETDPPEQTPLVTTVGEDERLQELAAACQAGDAQACDDLWNASDVGSDLERIGATCGGRHPDGEPNSFGNCVERANGSLPPTDTSVESTIVTSTTVSTDSTSISPITTPPTSDLLDQWVVIVASLAVDREGAEQRAQQEADRLREEGGHNAGFFRTDEYASLNPGYWVVYIEAFTEPDEASSACRAFLEDGVVEDCYHRQVSNTAE